jgi:hypothetical protein
METYLPRWVIYLFFSPDALTQSDVLIVLLAATGALLYGNLRKRLRVKELLVEQADLSNQTHRYRVTDCGWRTALFCTRCYSRLLRPGLARILPEEALDDSPLRRRFDEIDAAIDRLIQDQKLVP